MVRTLFILFAVHLLGAYAACAQAPCTSDERQRELLKRFPPAEARRSVGTERTTSVSDTATYDVPFVVHMIHDYGAENASDDSIVTAFAEWARVFMKQNADTFDVIAPLKPYIGNLKMRLHLATIDPNGQPTKGITRRQSYLTRDCDDQAKLDQWPPNQYVNVWFVNSITAGTAYAYFPYMATSTPYYDGPISYASAMNYVKVIPHELGHYFSAHHVWGDIGCGVDCSATDSVDDTPPTMGHLVTYCSAAALYDTVCANGYMVHYTDIFGADSLVDYPDTTNAQNIMDYTFCPRMFTIGQTVKMRGGLTSPLAGRSNLKSPANLVATGALNPMPDLPPIADYIMNKGVGAPVTDMRSYFLTANNSVSFQFQNASWNDTISAVSWAFSNGASSPTSASMTTVDNKFSIPGWVTVSVTATSNAGSNTLVNPQAVYVGDTVAAGGLGYSQAFASAAAVSNWPMFNYYNNQFKWEFFTGAGKGDNSCIRYRSFDTSCTGVLPRIKGTARGDFDDIVTPGFDLTGTTAPVYVNFYSSGGSTTEGIYGYTPYTLDTLEVFVSTTGGVRWAKLATYDGYTLQNNGLFSSEFVPTSASAWMARTVNVLVGYCTANTFFKFRYRPGNTGNNLYLDNFYISPLPAGVEEAMAASGRPFTVYPNPTAKGCTLLFRSGMEPQVHCVVADMTGRTVYEQNIAVTPNSLVQQPLERAALPAAGIYFVTITVDGMHQTQKLVVQP